MFNLVVLTGRLTATPELKTTPSGTSVCTFSIAVDRNYKKGEEKQTDFINLVAWRQTSEFISKNFQKGNLIGIEGSIQTRRYVDKDGKNRTAFEVVVNNAQFVESKKLADVNVEVDPLKTVADNLANAQPKTDLDFIEVDNDGDLLF